MPSSSRTGIQYSEKCIDCRGAMKAYVSWLRNKPAWISTYALPSSERALRQSSPSSSTPQDQIFLAGKFFYSAKGTVPVLGAGGQKPQKNPRVPGAKRETAP